MFMALLVDVKEDNIYSLLGTKILSLRYVSVYSVNLMLMALSVDLLI